MTGALELAEAIAKGSLEKAKYRGVKGEIKYWKQRVAFVKRVKIKHLKRVFA